jgi:hypothetical protein
MGGHFNGAHKRLPVHRDVAVDVTDDYCRIENGEAVRGTELVDLLADLSGAFPVGVTDSP